MSPKSRKAVLDHLTSSGNVTLRRLTRHDYRLMAQKNSPPPSWKEKVQLILSFPFSIFFVMLMLQNLAAWLIGRGRRSYLLHVERFPPPEDPPGGASVREPRRPIPPDGSLRLD